jgi:hypothetical protein
MYAEFVLDEGKEFDANAESTNNFKHQTYLHTLIFGKNKFYKLHLAILIEVLSKNKRLTK